MREAAEATRVSRSARRPDSRGFVTGNRRARHPRQRRRKAVIAALVAWPLLGVWLLYGGLGLPIVETR